MRYTKDLGLTKKQFEASKAALVLPKRSHARIEVQTTLDFYSENKEIVDFVTNKAGAKKEENRIGTTAPVLALAVKACLNGEPREKVGDFLELYSYGVCDNPEYNPVVGLRLDYVRFPNRYHMQKFWKIFYLSTQKAYRMFSEGLDRKVKNETEHRFSLLNIENDLLAEDFIDYYPLK